MSPERSAEERERARLEREAKRAAREGRPPPQAPPPTEVPPPLPGREAPLAPPPRVSAPASVRRRPAPVNPPQPPPEAPPVHPPEPPPETPAVHPPETPAVHPPETPAVHAPGPAELVPPPAPLPSRPEPPAPPPAENVPGAPDPRSARRATAQQILERRRAARSSPGAARGRGRIVALALAGVLGLALAWLALSLYQPFKGDGDGSVAVAIPSGSGVGEIAELLAQRGVVASSFFFQARATISGRAEDFKAGRFALREDMSYAAAIDALTQSPAAQSVSVTVPEGRARSEVKDLLGEELDGDYLALTKSSPLLDPAEYGAPRGSDLEGFLFPATYELKRGQGTRKLVSQQLQAFEREFAKVDMSFAKSKNLSRYDVLVIASMVEREAQLAKERPLIASVIYNRLSEGIPLGIDATIRFATGNWTRPLRESELAIDSPYNTRERQGLPPGPIGSPGLSSIKAAARPSKTGFLFYVVKPNACGEHAFSETDAEFQADVARYNSEREARGGQSPTDC